MSTAAMNSTTELQGIGSVLRSSEHQRSKSAASLRRTLSADMSSKKWQAKNGFSPLKRISSSEEFQAVPEEGGSKGGMFEIGSGKKEDEPPGQSDIWSTIISQKASPVATTYVHPLTKKNRSLSQQSLEICTESLGSETGSDGFSTRVPSLISDNEEEEKETAKATPTATATATPAVKKQEAGAVNKNSSAAKKSAPRSFPPPLASLSHTGLHMRPHRVEGRLVLEAVPVPALPQTNFQAQREGGRLLLTFANPKPNEATNPDKTRGGKTKTEIYEDVEEVMFPEEEEVMFPEEEEEIVEFESEEVEEEDDEYDTDEENQQVMNSNIVVEMKVSPPTRVINVHRSALMVNKIMGLTNIDPTWSSKLQKMVDAGNDQAPLVQSLPMVSRLIPSPTAASSLNKYDYSWRTNAVAAPTVCTHPLTQNPSPINKNNKFLLPKNLNPQEQQELVLMKGSKVDYLVPIFKGCKEPRRSLFWEPYCIAT